MKTTKRFSLVERNEIIFKSQQCLWTKEGELGRKYLMNDRGLKEETLRKFNLGYLPDTLNHQLAGRIIFPVYDPSGNLIAISSRFINKQDRMPVYWHESYQKSFYLYGVKESKDFIRKWKFVVVVEGQFDVLQLHNSSMFNTVGLCGNKLSSMQLAVIHRYCEDIIILLDKDLNLSGQRAMVKLIYPKMTHQQIINMNENQLLNSIEQIKYSEYSPKIGAVMFKENTDPDEFIRNKGFKQLRGMIKTKIREMRSAY